MPTLTATDAADKTEQLSEQDRTALYAVAPIRNVRKSDYVLPGVERSDSFFLIIDGSVEVFGVTDIPYGSPLVFGKRDLIGPMVPAEGVNFWIRALEPSIVLEITPKVLRSMSDKLQIWVYKTTLRSYDRSARYLRSANRDIDRKNRLMSDRWGCESAKVRQISETGVVRAFVDSVPKLPTFATDIAVRLLDDDVDVQEIAESIKQDAGLAAIVLKRVNSAEFGLPQRIETFYHACMILGFNKLYQLLLDEGVRQSICKTPETKRLHSHSCLISALCFEIAKISQGVLPQTVTTIGLLHDVGTSVVSLMAAQHPEVAPYTQLFDAAHIGASLVRRWGLPQRIVEVIDLQNQVEFMAPEALQTEHRKEIAVLHLAHLFEGMLLGKPVDLARQPFASDCCNLLKIAPADPQVLFDTRIAPILLKSRNRLPIEVRDLIGK
jgi:HD-like signal output (HDOD) protein